MLQPLADSLGRNRSFYVVAILQASGSLASALSYFVQSWELLSLGRLISGVSVGLSLGLQPMFFSEISPKSVLGFLNGMTGISLQIGLVVGSILALDTVFGSTDLWHFIFWFEFAITFVTMAVLPFIYESPKFILANNSDYDLAKESLTFFSHENVDDDIKEIEDEIESEKKNISFTTILKKPYLRLGLLIGTLTMLGCQNSGITAISFYSTQLFIDAGVPSNIAPYATVAVACTTLLASIISSFVIDRVGRRPLILVGLISLAALNLLFVIFTFIGNQTGAHWPGYVCVLVIIIFAFMFGIGPAVITWFVVAELMPHNARSTAISFVQALLWVSICVSNTIFYPLEEAVGEWSFFLFIIPLVAISIYLYFKFPETKNKSSVQIIRSLGYSVASTDETLKLTA